MRNKLIFAFLMFAIFIFMPRTASAWNCPAGQIRQQAPAGTPTSTPYYDVVEGIAFICVPTPTPGGSSSTQTQSQTATGTANSTNTNNNSAAGGQGGTSSSSATGGMATGGQGGSSSSSATGGKQSQSSNASANGSNNSTSVTNVAAPVIPVASAYAPTSLPSAPCIKGYGVGVQSPSAGISFGGGKVDVGCDERELARSYALLGSKIAACKVLIANERSQKAGVTLEDCMGPVEQVPTAESLGEYARRVGKGKS